MQDVMTYAEAINLAMHQAMEIDNSVICYGLGVDDPKRIFGTTAGLKEKFGQRVFDMPTAENAMTGIGVGAAIAGLKPVMVHQRVDFFLLAMDQLVNSAAKWHYMFDGKSSVPITIRLMLGRGWGQGPTHSQSLHSWFAHIPGLKVVMPSTPQEAKDLLLASIFDPNPVVFMEHRWLHHQQGKVESELDQQISALPSQAKVVRSGKDITIVAFSYLVVEARHAVEALLEKGIDAELIDLCVLKPMDWESVYKSVAKTGRLLALDMGHQTCSVASELVSRVSQECFTDLLSPPKALAMPDMPEPTSYGMTRGFHFGANEIAKLAARMVSGEELTFDELERTGHHDVPGDWFTGPF